MVTSKNRSINTGHAPEQQLIVLEFIRDGKFNGKQVEAGQTIKCTRSEARRFLSIDKTMVRILLD